MMMIVGCKQCGVSGSLEYGLRVHGESCKECHAHYPKKWSYCSAKCLIKHLKLLENHRCGNHFVCNGMTLVKDKPDKAWVYCTVCGDTRDIKIKNVGRYKISNIESWLND